MTKQGNQRAETSTLVVQVSYVLIKLSAARLTHVRILHLLRQRHGSRLRRRLGRWLRLHLGRWRRVGWWVPWVGRLHHRRHHDDWRGGWHVGVELVLLLAGDLAGHCLLQGLHLRGTGTPQGQKYCPPVQAF